MESFITVDDGNRSGEAMRKRTTKDRRTGARTLVIRLTRSETLNYAMAEWLRASTVPCLLPFKYESTDKAVLFYYDITGCVTLKSYFRTELVPDQYGRMLYSLADVTDACTAQGIPVGCVQWKPKMVYVSCDTGQVQYVIVPATGLPVLSDGPGTLLSEMGRAKNLRFLSAEDRRLQESVFDYRQRNTVFSAVEYRSFLDMLFPVLAAMAGAEATITEHTSTVARSINMQRGAVLDPVALLAGTASVEDVNRCRSVGQLVMDNVSGASSFVPVAPPAPAPPAAASPWTAPARPSAVPPLPTRNAQSAAGAPPMRGPVPVPGAPASVPMPVAPPPPARYATSPSSAGFEVTRIRDGQMLTASGTLAGRATIGRSREADLCVEGNGRVSRIHATITAMGDGRFAVTDHNSVNGTYVRGHLLPHGGTDYLSDGETFALAGDEFVIRALR